MMAVDFSLSALGFSDTFAVLRFLPSAFSGQEACMPNDSDDLTLSDVSVGTSFSGIGPYRLVQMLGVGGMGEVWRAEQTAPFHRTVALKLIKVGMDTRAVVARFESERQALALMEHPNIAKVFDAGATPEGRPFFVMEYVPGLPITKYWMLAKPMVSRESRFASSLA
jgi:serine/threonine protein kinase